MFNLISILIAILALPVLLIGLVPFLGILNYIVIAVTFFGILIGLLGDNKTGSALNVILLVISIVRLSHGFFIF